MSPEQPRPNLLHSAEAAIKKGLVNYGLEHPDIIRSLFRMNYGETNPDEIAGLLDDDTAIAIAANHQSNGEIVPLAIMTNEIRLAIDCRRRLQNPITPKIHFVLPMAASVEKGAQGMFTADAYEKIKPWLNKKGIKTILFATPNDVSKRDINLFEYRKNYKVIDDELAAGAGLAIFPEGTSHGGRLDNFGKRNGIIRVTKPTIFSRMALKVAQSGGKLVVVALACSGAYQVFDPITDKPTELAISTFRNPFNRTRLATVTVCKPFTLSSLGLHIPEPGKGQESEFHQSIHDELFKRISQLLPPKERGFYA